MPTFTLRDLFAVVTIAAILVTWWMDHRSQANIQAELRQTYSELEKRHFVLLPRVRAVTTAAVVTGQDVKAPRLPRQ